MLSNDSTDLKDYIQEILHILGDSGKIISKGYVKISTRWQNKDNKCLTTLKTSTTFGSYSLWPFKKSTKHLFQKYHVFAVLSFLQTTLI